MKNLTKILDKVNSTMRDRKYSKEIDFGVNTTLEEIMKLTGIKRCSVCRKHFVGLPEHKNTHLKFQ